MKKVFVMFVAALLLIGCSCENKKKGTTVKSNLNVENVNSTDKEYMFVNYGGDYKWFESCILLKDYLDEECDGTIAGISNVFQVVAEKERSADVIVVLTAHTPDTTAYETKQGFWIEDFPLQTEDVKLTFKEAFEKINEVNLPKPHSKNCILRRPVGPLACNAQYVFGNTQTTLWVDAVTGEVKESCPAFPEELKMPLDEWP